MRSLLDCVSRALRSLRSDPVLRQERRCDDSPERIKPAAVELPSPSSIPRKPFRTRHTRRRMDAHGRREWLDRDWTRSIPPWKGKRGEHLRHQTVRIRLLLLVGCGGEELVVGGDQANGGIASTIRTAGSFSRHPPLGLRTRRGSPAASAGSSYGSESIRRDAGFQHRGFVQFMDRCVRSRHQGSTPASESPVAWVRINRLPYLIKPVRSALKRQGPEQPPDGQARHQVRRTQVRPRSPPTTPPTHRPSE